MCFGSFLSDYFCLMSSAAVIAQLGERKTEDLKVSGSIPDCGKPFAPVTLFVDLSCGPLRSLFVLTTNIKYRHEDEALKYCREAKLLCACLFLGSAEKLSRAPKNPRYFYKKGNYRCNRYSKGLLAPRSQEPL